MSGSGSSGTGAPSNQRFTSYDRSEDTGLDYAVNRTYNSGQSRFTTVDPIGMASASIGDPQSLNLFVYVTNNPVDFVDPSGLYVDASSCVLVCAQSFDEDGNPTGPKDCEYRCEEAKIVESEETGPVTGGDPFPPDGGGAPLNDKEKKKLDKKIKKINKKLDKKKCREFLEKLGDDAISKLRAKLADKSNLFSAKRSTEITVEEAGLLRDDDGNFHTTENVAKKPAGRARDTTLKVLKWSVSKWFKKSYNGKVRAIVGRGGSIYFNKFSATTILHENLHRSTGKNDLDLADALGLKHNGTIPLASQAISKALKDHGCS